MRPIVVRDDLRSDRDGGSRRSTSRRRRLPRDDPSAPRDVCRPTTWVLSNPRVASVVREWSWSSAQASPITAVAFELDRRSRTPRSLYALERGSGARKVRWRLRDATTAFQRRARSRATLVVSDVSHSWRSGTRGTRRNPIADPLLASTVLPEAGPRPGEEEMPRPGLHGSRSGLMSYPGGPPAGPPAAKDNCPVIAAPDRRAPIRAIYND